MTNKYSLKFSDKLEDSVEYMNKLCSSWSIECCEDDVVLYSYHDGVDWKRHHAIAVNGVVKSLLKDISYSESYRNFKVVVECLNK